MKLIKLSQGLFAKVDDSDFETVNVFKWSAKKSCKNIYAVRRSGKSQVRMHRVILNIQDKNIHIDHEDRDGLNNQRLNIRVCSSGQNAANRKIAANKKSSKYKGAFPNGDKWYAALRTEGKLIKVGCNTEVEAAKIYNELAIKYHGEFANLNYL